MQQDSPAKKVRVYAREKRPWSWGSWQKPRGWAGLRKRHGRDRESAAREEGNLPPQSIQWQNHVNTYSWLKKKCLRKRLNNSPSSKHGWAHLLGMWAGMHYKTTTNMELFLQCHIGSCFSKKKPKFTSSLSKHCFLLYSSKHVFWFGTHFSTDAAIVEMVSSSKLNGIYTT